MRTHKYSHKLCTQVVDLMSVWRQRVSDAYHGGSVEQCMEETGTGGLKVLMLALIENEVAHPGKRRMAVCLDQKLLCRIACGT